MDVEGRKAVLKVDIDKLFEMEEEETKKGFSGTVKSGPAVEGLAEEMAAFKTEMEEAKAAKEAEESEGGEAEPAGEKKEGAGEGTGEKEKKKFAPARLPVIR